MTYINTEEFKNKYLYFDKKYIHHSLYNYIGNIFHIFPTITQNDNDVLTNYIKNSRIQYSNRFKLKLDKSLFHPYLSILDDEKIKVDIVRLKFTKEFIHKFDVRLKPITNIITIDITTNNYISTNELQIFNYNQINNKNKFLNNIISTNIFTKYLLHQDIHNSIINPILVAIMVKNDNYNAQIIQLQGITQIYRNITPNHIEMSYLIKKYFMLTNNGPVEINIKPFLMINIDFKIKKDHINIYITY